MEWVRAKKFEECTHRPAVEAMPVYPEVEKPKMYYESIERRQKVIAEKELKLFAEENSHLEVERRLKKLKEMDVSPPSFLEREDNRQRRKILFYVDITVKPGKYCWRQCRIGRVGVAENDDLAEQAENFAKAYGLSASIKEKVWRILNASLDKYLAQISS